MEHAGKDRYAVLSLHGVIIGVLFFVLVGSTGFSTGENSSPWEAKPITKAVADTQHIHLEPGWNFVSTRLTPNDPKLEAILSDISATIPMLQNGNGGIFYPAASLNSAGEWDVYEGYMVYAEDAEVLVIEGEPLSEDMVFPLTEGWNLIPFPLDTPLNVTDALSSIETVLLTAKDELGQVFLPDDGINEIGQLKPGQAYQVYVSDDVDLTYDESDPDDEWTYDAECIAADNSFLLHDYQTEEYSLTEGPLTFENDSAAIFANAKILNEAIDNVGSQEGETILCLPEGRFDVINPEIMPGIHDGPRQTFSVSIDASDFTLWGAGRDEGGTGIYTNGKYDLIEGEVFRGHGLYLVRDNQNITLRDFELNGQGALPGDSTAWTGCNRWRSDEDRISCWDTSHKGLVSSWGGGTVENVLVERVAVRSYKGEMVYVGGRGLRTATYRDMIVEDTNAQTFDSHGVDVVVEDSYFGLSYIWIEIQPLWGEGDLGTNATFTGNTFENCSTGHCVALGQGDNTTVPYLFEGNTFRHCNFDSGSSGNVLGIGEASAGPTTLRDNELVDCRPVTGISGGGEFSGPRANIFIEDNTVHSLRNSRAVDLTFGMVNLNITGNTFAFEEGFEGGAFRYGWSSYSGTFENNTFENEERFDSQGGAPGMVLLKTGNSYTHGPDWRRDFVSDAGELLMPLHEHHRVANSGDYTEAFLRTDIYPDGFETTFNIDPSSTRPDLTFTTDNPTYDLDTAVTLTQAGQETITLRFNGDTERWELPD